MPKIREHNEWFRSVKMGGGKSGPCCPAKLEPNEFIWSWGEYIRVKWHTVKHFCKNCFEKEVQKPLVDHAGPCGCTINLIGKGEKLPEWLKLPEPETCAA